MLTPHCLWRGRNIAGRILQRRIPPNPAPKANHTDTDSITLDEGVQNSCHSCACPQRIGALPPRSHGAG